MGKGENKTTSFGNLGKSKPKEEDFGFSTTVEICRKTFVGEIPLRQRASLEVAGPGGGTRFFELGEGEVLLGRSSECGVHLAVDNVSRKHARIVFRNEEYHLEDLQSTNGTYVNGIKVVKCILRNNDHIEIGGVKILFNEEKTIHGK